MYLTSKHGILGKYVCLVCKVLCKAEAIIKQYQAVAKWPNTNVLRVWLSKKIFVRVGEGDKQP